jgi:hypothetical protein
MINSTNIKVPKKYHAAIKELYQDDDGYWCILNDGYNADGIDSKSECRVANGEDVKEILRQIRLFRKI